MHGTLAQPYSLLAFLYAGCIIGLLTGVLRAFRLLCRRSAPLVFADALYALLCAGIAACTFYFAEKGALRFYGFLVIALGALSCEMIAGAPLVLLAQKAAAHRREREREAARIL